ncbi:MAG: hypothetical protein M9952_05835 [Microthrixaceae bacterium]|nr:hypothetical protein [Microthrixaceae bacterium]
MFEQSDVIRTATRLNPAWSDPDAIVSLIRSAGPLSPLANYAANDAEMATLSTQENSFTPPWFRQDFVRGGEVLVDGAEVIFNNPNFLAAARELAGPDAVLRPTAVYVNVMGPTPFAFPAHLDIAAFRGITRAHYPIWLLKVMMSSGLFEEWRTTIFTAVSWFYDGEGGDFHFWPEGPSGTVGVESPPFSNVGVIADNETTFHGVAPLGAPGATMPEGLHSGCHLVRGDGGWDIVDGDRLVSRIDDADARITVSWKAECFADAEAAQRVDDGEDALTLDMVVDRFLDDLAARGIEAERPADPFGDEAFVAVLAAAYPEVAPELVA